MESIAFRSVAVSRRTAQRLVERNRLASAAALIHVVFVDPAAWAAMRLVTGFCFAGLYVVAESWLNDRATNETRGRLLSIYVAVILGGMASGQFMLNAADPGGFELENVPLGGRQS